MDGKPLPEPEFKAIQLPESAWAIYEGEYQLMPDMVLTVTKSGNRLWGQATGQGRIEFFPSAEHKFFTNDIVARMEFVQEGDHISKLVWYQGGQTIPAPKIK